ncbi:hypothetical protein D6D02_05345, partial [Aureobasidium pullulans]
LAQQRVALNLSGKLKSIRRCRGNRGGERRRLRAPVPVWATACIYASEINDDIDTTKDNSEGLASSVVNGGGTHMRLAFVALANGGGSIMQSERQEQCEWQSGLGL